MRQQLDVRGQQRAVAVTDADDEVDDVAWIDERQWLLAWSVYDVVENYRYQTCPRTPGPESSSYLYLYNKGRKTQVQF